MDEYELHTPEDVSIIEKAEKAERMKRKRESLDESIREQERQTDAAARRDVRASQDEVIREQERQRNTAVRRNVRASQDEVIREQERQTDARGLVPSLRFCIGAEVMLIARNIALPFKLFNGACGVIQFIYYADGTSPPDLPTAVFVHFSSYCGPAFFTLHPKVVPIVPIRMEWETPHGTCSRLQIPLVLSWAISTHKSQGQSMQMVRIDIGAKELTTGATYVALSRATSLQGILLVPQDNRSNFLSRWLSIGNGAMMQLRKNEDIRLLQLESNVTDVVTML